MSRFSWGFFGFIAFVVVVLASVIFRIWLEVKHPCIVEDPEVTFMGWAQVDSAMIPLYGNACLERK